MGQGGYNLLKWNIPESGLAVREVSDEPLAFWVDASGRFIHGNDYGFCRKVDGKYDKWLTFVTDALGNESPEKPAELRNVPECAGSDTTTQVRIVPAGESYPYLDPRNPPADGTFVCYRIGLRCYRLMLAKNVVLKEVQDGLVCDFDDAVLQWLAPRELGEPRWEDVRPVDYPPGNIMESELDDCDLRHYLSPTASGIGGYVYPSIDSHGKIEWSGGHRLTEMGPPMFVRDYWKKDRVTGDSTRHDLYWWPATAYGDGDGGNIEAENVLPQLRSQRGLVERIFELNEPDKQPPEPGTAFDLILLCKTYNYHARKNKLLEIHHRHQANPERRIIWIAEGTSNKYYNTKVSGYLVQIVPVPPKGRSAA